MLIRKGGVTSLHQMTTRRTDVTQSASGNSMRSNPKREPLVLRKDSKKMTGSL
jgi:hypothetical protein